MTTKALTGAAAWFGGRSVADPQLAPDSSRVAFVTGLADGAQLALVPAAGGLEEWLACSPPVKRVSQSGGGAFGWLPDGSGIVYIGVDGCIHLHDLISGSTRALTTRDDSPSCISVSPDGTWVAYVADLADVAVVSTSSQGDWPRRISSGADFVVDPTWSADGALLAWHEWDDPNMAWDSSRIAVRAVDCSSPVRTVAGGDGVSVAQPRFLPDGSGLLFLSDETGWLNLWRVDLPELTNSRPLLSEDREHGDPTWGPGQRSYCVVADATRVLIARNHSGRGELVSVAVDGSQVKRVAGGTFSGLHGASDSAVAVVTGPRQGPCIVSIDDASDTVSKLARGPLRGVGESAGDPEDVSWDSEGVEIPGRLYRAREVEGPAPLLVWIHGGPTSQSAATLTPRIAYFVERGWSVLVPDYRGTSGWGREFAQALNGQWGRADVLDVAAGMAAAIEEGWALPHQMVPYGGSAGGMTTLLLMTNFSELCAAGVAVYPVADLLDLANSTWRFEAHYTDHLVGPLPEAYETYVARSPINLAGRIHKPLLLLHGEDDVVVPASQSARLAESVRRAGGVVEHHVYESEGHGWRRSSTKIDELQRIDEFLRSHVLHVGTTGDNS